MEMIYYTIAALLLYGISDYILNAIEIKLKKRLTNRSLVFFAIISVLAILSFGLIQAIFNEPGNVQPVNTQANNAPAQKLPVVIPGEASPSQTQPEQAEPTKIIQPNN